MMAYNLRFFLCCILALVLCSSGCTSYAPSVIKDPIVTDLSYRNGQLLYKGEEVDCIKLKRPWYIAMLPDDMLQWGFSGFMFVAGIGVSSMGGGGGGTGGGSNQATTPPVTTTSSGGGGGGGSSSSATSTSSNDSSGGGGGSAPPSTPPPTEFETPD